MPRSWTVDRLGALAELSGSELTSVLLEEMRQRATARSPAEVLAQYSRDRFTTPALVDQRTSVSYSTAPCQNQRRRLRS